MNELVFDERLFEIMPLSIYSANKFFFYLTWLGFVMPHVDVLVTVLFLTLSVSLWYNFFKTWKGDPGLIKVTEDQRFRAIVELAERSNDKNPFDQRVFCVTCLVKRPLRLVEMQKLNVFPINTYLKTFFQVETLFSL